MNMKEMRYKEVLPEETVKNIKNILHNNNIEVEEDWQDKSSVDTYALRLTIKGTGFGQNGKGMTKDFAAASAYAELLERYQNGTMRYRIEKPTEEFPFSIAPDEKEMTVEELFTENVSFLNNILNDNNKADTSDSEKIDFLKEVLNGKSKLVPPQVKHISIPYYSVKDKSVKYIPYMLYGYLCGSNGMCAGNSREEALIEGISEILERHVSMKLFFNSIAFPEIPNTYLQNFPTVYNMITKLRNNTEYVCKLVDCSLGGKYPVAGLFVIEKNTGKFGFKLGAHPDYGIAMERCFTEAAQGIDIYDYAKSCLFDFDDSNVISNENINEFLDTYVANMPYQIWQEKPSFDFTQMPDVSNLSNSEILNNLVDSIINEGYDILIRDVSVLGFPSFSIIIPGMVEMNRGPQAGWFNAYTTVQYLLQHTYEINESNIKEVIATLEKMHSEMGIYNLSKFVSVKDLHAFPCDSFKMGTKFFLAVCYLMDSQYDKATKLLEDIVFIGTHFCDDEKESVFMRAIYYYASGMSKLNSHKAVMHYINILFDEIISAGIDMVFSDKTCIIKRLYNLSSDVFVESDDRYFLPFMKTLRQKQKENQIDQMKNSEIFK